ncbi:MAG: tRNA uridine-5-carboxymethylaminomethyl(34) synthesis GTPase MnmE, partial [Thermodesulfobacteriota bacterium]
MTNPIDTNIDTIAAIATPVGEGGIGIIRISGPGALPATSRVFIPAGSVPLEERRLVYGRIVQAEPTDGVSTIDNGFAVFMPAPRSYTGEDVVELHCHGGSQVLSRVLSAVLDPSIHPAVRLAVEGEFTRRAFLNSRMDLAQAEAVIDVIRAGSEGALKAASARLAGGLSVEINTIKEKLATALARIEAALDFPEEEDVEKNPDNNAGLLTALEECSEVIKGLIDTYATGSALRDGVKALILGRPNTGKSSLLNTLLKEERAIVTEVAGTTRDVIEEVLDISGLKIRLMDTAGLRETTDRIESLGVAAALGRVEAAELLLFVVDADMVTAVDLELLTLIEEAEGKRILVVANKVDLIDGPKRQEVAALFKDRDIVFISALTGDGLKDFEEAIYHSATGASKEDITQMALVASVRQKTALENALAGIAEAAESVKKSMDGEFIAVDLRRAINHLGEITGEVTT